MKCGAWGRTFLCRSLLTATNASVGLGQQGKERQLHTASDLRGTVVHDEPAASYVSCVPVAYVPSNNNAAGSTPAGNTAAVVDGAHFKDVGVRGTMAVSNARRISLAEADAEVEAQLQRTRNSAASIIHGQRVQQLREEEALLQASLQRLRAERELAKAHFVCDDELRCFRRGVREREGVLATAVRGNKIQLMTAVAKGEVEGEQDCDVGEEVMRREEMQEQQDEVTEVSQNTSHAVDDEAPVCQDPVAGETEEDDSPAAVLGELLGVPASADADASQQCFRSRSNLPGKRRDAVHSYQTAAPVRKTSGLLRGATSQSSRTVRRGRPMKKVPSSSGPRGKVTASSTSSPLKHSKTRSAPKAAKTRAAPKAAKTRAAPRAAKTRAAPKAAKTRAGPRAAKTRAAPKAAKTRAAQTAAKTRAAQTAAKTRAAQTAAKTRAAPRAAKTRAAPKVANKRRIKSYTVQ